MKKIFIILAGTMLFSCNYLDVVPEGSATKEDVFRTHKQVTNFLATLYTYIPNMPSYRYFPDFCAGDDIITGPGGGVRYFPYKSMLYGYESSSSTYYGLWDATGSTPTGRTNYNIFEGIRFCHMMINNVDGVPMDDYYKLQYKGEAKFLVAYYHWLMMAMYGPTVIIKDEMSMATPEAEVFVSRSTFDEGVAYIVQMLDEAAELMPTAKHTDSGYYGRISSMTAKALKARVLLYAASPLVNGNTEFYSDFKNHDGTHLINQVYDKEKWEKARVAAGQAIEFAEANGYKLYESPNAIGAATDFERGTINYHDAFCQERWTLDEYIWAFGDQTGIQHIQKYAPPRSKLPYSSDGFCGYLVPTFECVERYLSKNGLPMDVDPATKNLDLYSVADGDNTALLHRNREPRFYASIGYDRGEYDINGGTTELQLRGGEAHGSTLNSNNEYQSCTGYLMKKYIHKALAWNSSNNTISYRSYAFPLIRLAELYLSYAEADLEYNGSLSDESLAYLNKVRKRAGLPDFQDSWALVGGIPTDPEVLRDVVRRERDVELAMEGHRYNDMRRWKIAHEVMSKKTKAWNLDGKTQADFYKLSAMPESGTRVFEAPKHYWLAIPINQININENLVQNPGY